MDEIKDVTNRTTEKEANFQLVIIKVHEANNVMLIFGLICVCIVLQNNTSTSKI